MGNFNENSLFESGMSAVDFFASENNQKSILEEISAFKDAELREAFLQVFNPPEGDDAYLTGSGVVTEREITQMQDVPDGSVQLEIVRLSNDAAVLSLMKRFRFCPDAERALLKRGNMALLQPYFSLYPLHKTVQETLAKLAIKSAEGKIFLEAYLEQHKLSVGALQILIQQSCMELLETYVQHYPLGSTVIAFAVAMSEKRIDFLLPLCRRPQDKIVLALKIRRIPKLKDRKKYAFSKDVCNLLREIPAGETMELFDRLRPEEEKVLAELPDKALLKGYVKHYGLSFGAELALVRLNDRAMFDEYAKRYDLSYRCLQAMIEDENEELFDAYLRIRRLSHTLVTFLFKYGSKKMVEIYRSHYFF